MKLTKELEFQIKNCEEFGHSDIYLDFDYAKELLKVINERFELTQENKRLQRFKDYFDDLYNTGLEVANWHLNGSLEPFDSFYDSAMEWIERDETK